MCRVKFANDLPDVPFPPKFLVYPADEKRFGTHKITDYLIN